VGADNIICWDSFVAFDWLFTCNCLIVAQELFIS
jgi:hypothetical protein